MPGKTIPRPKAILCISAHWETQGTQVTDMESPPTIHDFGGFPKALYEVQYPAPGSSWLALQIKNTIKKAEVLFNESWGLDRGCWSGLRRMFPNADIPVVQLSLDYTKSAQYHYELAKELLPLRKKDVLIVGSGNLVHNLFMISVLPISISVKELSFKTGANSRTSCCIMWPKCIWTKRRYQILSGNAKSRINK